MATVIIHTSAFPQAEPYYRLVPWQVVGPTPRDLAITDRVLQPQMTLRSVLQALRTVPAGGEAIIVSHGAAGGLTVPLGNDTRIQSGTQAVDALTSTMATEQHSAEVLGIPVRALRELRELAAAVRAQRLSQIDIRACNMGASPYALESLKRLLGPGRIGAPRILNAYGSIAPGTVVHDPTQWDRWLSNHPNARVHTYSSEERIAMWPHPEPHRGTLSTIVSSPTVMERWVRDRLARGKPLGQMPRSGPTREVPYHAAFHWQWSFPMIWPGDSDYLEQMVYV